MTNPNNENEQALSANFDKEVYESIRATLAEARTSVVTAVNSAMVNAYWEIGRQIAEAVGDRAEYGKNLLAYLSERLTQEFGKGFTERNLRFMRQFYHFFPIRNALRTELAWTHYRLLMRVDEPNRREFYLNECADSGWTSRQLERQIGSFYYERLLATQKEHRPEITTEHGEHYYIDLVFYNYILKCFFIIDLKAGKLTYQDVGQIDFYVRLFNEKIKQADDNPTIGLVLVTDKDESIVKYSVLADNEKLFASKYKLYLPTEEELKAELQRERELIERQIEESEEN